MISIYSIHATANCSSPLPLTLYILVDFLCVQRKQKPPPESAFAEARGSAERPEVSSITLRADARWGPAVPGGIQATASGTP